MDKGESLWYRRSFGVLLMHDAAWRSEPGCVYTCQHMEGIYIYLPCAATCMVAATLCIKTFNKKSSTKRRILKVHFKVIFSRNLEITFNHYKREGYYMIFNH